MIWFISSDMTIGMGNEGRKVWLVPYWVDCSSHLGELSKSLAAYNFYCIIHGKLWCRCWIIFLLAIKSSFLYYVISERRNVRQTKFYFSIVKCVKTFKFPQWTLSWRQLHKTNKNQAKFTHFFFSLLHQFQFEPHGMKKRQTLSIFFANNTCPFPRQNNIFEATKIFHHLRSNNVDDNRTQFLNLYVQF